MKRYELSFETGRGKSFLEWLDYRVKELPLSGQGSKYFVTLVPQMQQAINADQLRIFIDIVDISKSANACFFSDDEELGNFLKEVNSNCESDYVGVEVEVESKSKDIDYGLTKNNAIKIVHDLLKWLIKQGLSNGCEIKSQGESKHCNKLEDMEKTKARPYCEIKPGIHGFRETPPTLEEMVTELEKKLKNQEYNHKKTVQEFQEKNNNLKEEVANLKDKLQKIEEELRETLVQLGHVTIEKEKLLNEKKRNISFNKTFRQNVINVSSGATFVSQQSLPSEASTSAASKLTIGAEALPKCTDQQTDDASISEKFSANLVAAVSVQESREESRGREGVSLSNIPTTAVERSVYNNYKLLLLTIGDRLLSGDVAKLKDWAGRVHAVNVASDISEMFLELDRKGVISASNLEELRKFFGKILRVDLVHLIDCFLQGDYTHLRSTSSNRIPGNNSRVNSSYTGSTVSRVTDVARFPTWPTSESGNPRNSQLVDAKESFADKRPERQDSLVKLHSPVKNCRVGSFQAAIAKEAIQGTVVTDGSVPHDDDVRDGTGSGISQNNKTGGKSLPSRSPANHDRGSRVVMGSNGNKLSKFERPDSPRNRGSNPQDSQDDSDDDEQWLCSHYKRRCYVKFHCCDKYWPCHRCHNNESKCGQKKLKSRDTKFIKCVKCGKEQEFSGRSQFCIQCNAKFAKYFCPICKHLTGKDDKPYHCEKCGICRIHGDRSFHCDVCGVCLDVQLRGNHKCRAGSAHDECCICLEDAFTGCQILPCSHKVHKECATQMIRNGITRCPICRESFAHKLERRPIQPPKKHKGKKREPWP